MSLFKDVQFRRPYAFALSGYGEGFGGMGMWKKFCLFVWLGTVVMGCGAVGQASPTLLFRLTETPRFITPPPTRVRVVKRTRNAPSSKPTMLPQAVAQATIFARATASPFATPQTAVVQAGRPYRIEVERGTLRMQVEIAQETFMAGESGQAQITLENHGTETVWLTGGIQSVIQMVLLDEQGHETAPYPWQPLIIPGMPRGAEIKAGESFSETIAFQIPSADLVANHTLALWGVARFSGTAHENGDGSDGLWLPIEAGPLALEIVRPVAAKQAVADLTIDRSGWLLQVKDLQGHALHPAWGYFEAQSANGTMTWSLPPSADGMWKHAWDGSLTESENEVKVRAWVGTPGYLLATTTQTFKANGAPAREFNTYSPETQIFTDFDAAQTALGAPLWGLPVGEFDTARIEFLATDKQRWMKTRQLYRFGHGNWLELIQENTTQQHESAGWGQARYEADALQVQIDGAPGYLVKRLGWWVLDWKRENVGFELRLQVEAMTQAQLLDAARSAAP